MKTSAKQLVAACGVVLMTSPLGFAAQTVAAPKAPSGTQAVAGAKPDQAATGQSESGASSKKHRRRHKKSGKSKAPKGAAGTSTPGGTAPGTK